MPKLSEIKYIQERKVVLETSADGMKPLHINGSKPPRDALTVYYRPHSWTGEHEETIAEQGLRDNDKVSAFWIARTLATVARWDLQHDDGTVIPLTQEALKPLPSDLLAAIVIGCVNEMLPSKSGDSEDSSEARAR